MATLALLSLLACDPDGSPSQPAPEPLDSASASDTSTPFSSTTSYAGTAPPDYTSDVRLLPGAAIASADPLAASVSIAAPYGCGRFWGPVGDHDGDGVADFGLSCGAAGALGELHLYAGSALLAPGPAPFATVASTLSGGNWKEHPTSLGDLDGDGRDELGMRFDGPQCGAYTNLQAYVHAGADLVGIVPIEAARWTIDADGYAADVGLVAAGDLDGDGLGDLLAPQRMGNALEHEVFAVSASTLATQPPGVYVASSADLARLVERPGDARFAEFPAPLGDLDGDGLADLAFATHGGAVPVFLGADLRGVVDLASAHATVAGSSPELFSSWVAPVGDVDADGLIDVAFALEGVDDGTEVALVTGATLAAGGVIALGAQPGAFSVEGAAEGSAACDLDGDGLRELILESEPGEQSIYRGADLLAPDPPAWVVLRPSWTVRCAGDVDGDGLEDLAIAKPI